MRMIITGGVEPFDMDQMMERDMEVAHHGASAPISALSTVADALPGLGIVAAVLGVVITMGALAGPPEELGKKVAAALVGTFLGILLCYGVVGPLSANMTKAVDEEHSYMHVLRVLMLASMKGNAAADRRRDRAACDSVARPPDLRRAGGGLPRRIGCLQPRSKRRLRSEMAKPQIIVIKRVQSHGVHHGGAWKVAYADFVTAMMALFIVLWLLNTSDHTRKVIAGYFNDPMGKKTESGTDRAGAGEAMPIGKTDIEKLKTQLENHIQQTANLKDLSKQVEMAVTPEGLRIELLESKDGTFFDTGSTTLKPGGRDMLNLLASSSHPCRTKSPSRVTPTLSRSRERTSSTPTGNSLKSAPTSRGG